MWSLKEIIRNGISHAILHTITLLAQDTQRLTILVEQFQTSTSRVATQPILQYQWTEKQYIMLQVPPDFYIPDFDEDEQNPDERINRK